MKVLIVDDNANDRKLLRYNLERHGCESVIEAVDGQEGLGLARTHRPDLIISDALMPRMDGFEFLRAVKMDAELKSIPFVFHSAVYTGLKDKELALSLGAEAFIAKPMEPEAFWEELTTILQQRKTARENPVAAELMEEEKEYLRKYSGVVAAKLEEKISELENTLIEREKAEKALLESEIQRCQLQAELTCAAKVQEKLLPVSFPDLPNFEFAARCLPAHQVGGDFYDWIEVAPGIIALTLGDVMGSGMTAAMLMSTVRAAVHTATLQNRPAEAVQLAERALRSDLESAESFVTLFHAHLDIYSRTLTFVDCGHGYVLLRRADGTFEELAPRGLPLGVPSKDRYQEGMLTFAEGDALILYSDGLIDARPDLALNNRVLADRIDSIMGARDMMESLLALPALDGPPPDDLTVMVIRCNGEICRT